MKSINFIELAQISKAERMALMLRTENDLSSYEDEVRPIIDDVKNRGDVALVHYAAMLENASIGLDSLRVSAEEFEQAFELVDPKVVEAIKYGIENIRNFHSAQKPLQYWMKEVRPGAFAGERV